MRQTCDKLATLLKQTGDKLVTFMRPAYNMVVTESRSRLQQADDRFVIYDSTEIGRNLNFVKVAIVSDLKELEAMLG